MNKGTRVCGKRCHHARRPACRCWCGGLFHGAAGESARDEFRQAFNVDAVPTTDTKFRELTGQPDLFGEGLAAGDDWRKRKDRTP